MRQQTATQSQKQTITTPPIRGGVLQRKCTCGQHTISGGECHECRKKRGNLQRKAAGHTDPETIPPIVHETLILPSQPLGAEMQAPMESRFNHDFSHVQLRANQPLIQSMPLNETAMSAENAVSSATTVSQPAVTVSEPRVDDPQAIQEQLRNGRPLDSNVRTRMESAFGTSFSHIHIHSDSKAANLSSNLNARAFTVGQNIAFGAGEYQPGTVYGDALIAHELAHTIQQGSASASVVSMEVGDASYSNLERDADRSALHAVTSVWQKTMGAASNLVRETMPRLRSGISIQQQSRTTRRRCPRRIRRNTTLTRDCRGRIQVRRNNIVLDCGGHTITGFGRDHGILLRNRRGVTVKNCNITNFSNGVALRRSNHNTFIDNKSFNNNRDGFDLNDSNENAFVGNSATGHSRSNGIELDGCNGNTFWMNSVSDNQDGIDLNQSNENKFFINQANSNLRDGFRINRNSNGNTLTVNFANNNARDGFHIDGNSDNNTLRVNFANNNARDGFRIDGNSDNNAFSLNVANNNASDDFDLRSGTGNTCYVNSFTHPNCPAP